MENIVGGYFCEETGDREKAKEDSQVVRKRERREIIEFGWRVGVGTSSSGTIRRARLGSSR